MHTWPEEDDDMTVGPVLQDWVCEISWKKQTVLLVALRSPDTLTTLALKKITVWLRTRVLRNADPQTGFMHGNLQTLPLFEHIDREFERLPLHMAHHFILAMEVIGFEHPDTRVRATAWKFYSDAVDAQHLNPETWDQYESRYQDNADRVEEGLS
jgi:hypothetical protein